MGIKERLEEIKDRVEEAAKRSGREPDDVRIIAVTKTFPREVVEEAISLGLKEFGENYVQEALSKYQGLEGIKLHMIGHLQRNKVKKALEIFHVIQTLDSIKLAREIEKRSKNTIPCLVQINIGGEETKSGIDPKELFKFLEELNEMKNIQVIGLMTIPPYTKDEKRLRNYFGEMRRLLEEANKLGAYRNPLKELSMGMTEDFEIAIEEGATMVRIGRGIFGDRLD